MKTWIRGAIVVGALALPLGGCFTTTLNHGHVIPSERVRDIQVGSSREQVELLLGSPSTVSRLNGEAYYYISQTTETTAFLSPDVVERRVVAIYFDEDGFVRDTGYYSLEDGKVLDVLTRKTRTGGSDYGFLTQILRGAKNPSLGL
ncbi:MULTISPECIES: outer membrane protein assembly factor BamE [unclassified Stappia]|jgi:outer membrane protein assembly factor BamE (lipoprotein component of BamABCDE complex)|uniref:outer membrane protein assembly factor BamE n=1 Tax=unclassified Stappia TaxID=2629676 RepID=UPI00273EBC96|nr:outer membrane protein assembly factor BamE [Stappia sp. MMSF_3263]